MSARFEKEISESEYWAFVKEVAQRVEKRPEWQKGAIDRPANTLLNDKKPKPVTPTKK